jgi:GT2 family glycosyltransferase
MDIICKNEQKFTDMIYAWTFLGPFMQRIFGTGNRRKQPDQNTSQQAEVLQDSSLLVNKEAIGPDGLFDEDLKFYYTEDDISMRARINGWKLLYAPELRVMHHHQYSTRKIDKTKIEWIYMRDALTYARKFCGSYRTLLLLTPAACITFFIRVLYWQLTDRSQWK